MLDPFPMAIQGNNAQKQWAFATNFTAIYHTFMLSCPTLPIPPYHELPHVARVTMPWQYASLICHSTGEVKSADILALCSPPLAYLGWRAWGFLLAPSPKRQQELPPSHFCSAQVWSKAWIHSFGTGAKYCNLSTTPLHSLDTFTDTSSNG